MHTEIKEENGVVVLSVDGDILQENVEIFKTQLDKLFKEGKKLLILDMVHCHYVTSMSLSAIFHAKKRFREAGGDIRISGINRLIRNLFELTNLKQAVDIFEDLPSAISSFLKKNS